MVCCKKKPMEDKPEITVPFPDGGWGWLVCMATFTTQFIVLGTMNNFGVVYVELLNEFKTGKADAGNGDFFFRTFYFKFCCDKNKMQISFLLFDILNILRWTQIAYNCYLNDLTVSA